MHGHNSLNNGMSLGNSVNDLSARCHQLYHSYCSILDWIKNIFAYTNQLELEGYFSQLPFNKFVSNQLFQWLIPSEKTVLEKEIILLQKSLTEIKEGEQVQSCKNRLLQIITQLEKRINFLESVKCSFLSFNLLKTALLIKVITHQNLTNVNFQTQSVPDSKTTVAGVSSVGANTQNIIQSNATSTSFGVMEVDNDSSDKPKSSDQNDTEMEVEPDVSQRVDSESSEENDQTTPAVTEYEDLSAEFSLPSLFSTQNVSGKNKEDSSSSMSIDSESFDESDLSSELFSEDDSFSPTPSPSPPPVPAQIDDQKNSTYPSTFFNLKLQFNNERLSAQIMQDLNLSQVEQPHNRQVTQSLLTNLMNDLNIRPTDFSKMTRKR